MLLARPQLIKVLILEEEIPLSAMTVTNIELEMSSAEAELSIND